MCVFRLLNRDGVLMAYAGPPERQSQVSSAVASSIWDVYDKGGKAVLAGEHLDFLLIDCEVRTMGNVCMCCVCVVSVCVRGGESMSTHVYCWHSCNQLFVWLTHYKFCP